MHNKFSTDAARGIALTIKEGILLNANKTKRLRLITLLNTFGFRSKNKSRLDSINQALLDNEIFAIPAIENCQREDWVKLTLINSAQNQSGKSAFWGCDLTDKNFANEKEVEIRFIIPILNHLGYTENDRVDGCPIEITIGSRRERGEADFVLYDGQSRSRESVLLVVEAKKTGTRLAKSIEQARSYSISLGAPFYMVTNGDEIRVFKSISIHESDLEVFNSTRSNLYKDWDSLVNIISKSSASSYKQSLRSKHL